MRTLPAVAVAFLVASALASADPAPKLSGKVGEALRKTAKDGVEFKGRAASTSPAGTIIQGMGVAVEGSFKATVADGTAGVVLENRDYKLEFYRKGERIAKRLTAGDTPTPDIGKFTGELGRLLDLEALEKCLADGKDFKAKEDTEEVDGEACEVVTFRLESEAVEGGAGEDGGSMLAVKEVAVKVWLAPKGAGVKKMQVKITRGYSEAMVGGVQGDDEDGPSKEQKTEILAGARFSTTYTLTTAKTGPECKVTVPDDLREYLGD